MDTQTAAPPRRAKRLKRLWRPAAGLVAAVGIGVTASWWFTEGAVHREHRQRLCPGRHRRARVAHRGRCGRHQGGRQPACACRRSADRARSVRLARAAGAGNGRRRRGHRRDRDGAAPGGATAGNHPRGADRRLPRHRPSRRGQAPMRRVRERWYRLAGPRGRPTTRRSPMRARRTPLSPPPRRRRRRRSSSWPCCRRR